ncbi:hypothetical protein Tco_0405828 [Tanacetum coccineum]
MRESDNSLRRFVKKILMKKRRDCYDILQIRGRDSSEGLIQFLVLEDSLPPGIERTLERIGDIVFLDNLLNDDSIPEYERFTFNIEPDAPVINNFDELNEDEYFDPGGGEIDVSQNIEDDDSFAFVIRTFLPIARILKTIVLGVLSIVHSLFNPSHAYIGNLIS